MTGAAHVFQSTSPYSAADLTPDPDNGPYLTVAHGLNTLLPQVALYCYEDMGGGQIVHHQMTQGFKGYRIMVVDANTIRVHLNAGTFRGQWKATVIG